MTYAERLLTPNEIKITMEEQKPTSPHLHLYNKTELKQTLWPSETYKEFMIAVIQYHISDAAAKPMLQIIKKHCNESLPRSAQKNFLLDYQEQWELSNMVQHLILLDNNQNIISNWYRNLPDAKVLIGFLPHLITRDNKLRVSKEFRQKQQGLEQYDLEYLLNPLLKKWQ
ncbi:1050_t:CDS:2 [Entrophospora sp. SA101]|nr:1050_t:CDS:2 [Entrophospora sp. SA101]